MKTALAIIMAAVSAGCGTPDSQIAKHPTGVLERRHADLTQRIKDDELGVYFGPIRWISHAIEERGVTKENQAIEQELESRQDNNNEKRIGMKTSLAAPQIDEGIDNGRE
jgi:hypothetical protein